MHKLGAMGRRDFVNREVIRRNSTLRYLTLRIDDGLSFIRGEELAADDNVTADSQGDDDC